MLTTFDHVTLVVNDVEAASRGYERLLGHPPSWRGGHPELGTDGALFSLANAVVELAGPRPGAPEADGLREWLAARGEGMQAIALGTDDAAASSAAFRQRGLRATPPQPGEARGVDGSLRRYQTVEVSPRAARGLQVLAVQREGGSLRADAAQLAGAPASIDALDHVVLRTSDPEAAIALYGQGLGIRLALDREVRGARMLFFRIGGVSIEVVEDPAAGAVDVFAGVAYRVQDLDAAHDRMRAVGLAVSEVRDGAKPGTRVFTVRDGTSGVPTLILRDPSRDGALAGSVRRSSSRTDSMSEKSKQEERVGAAPTKPGGTDLQELARKLRDAARSLPDHLRDDAVSAADKIHEHATSERPDAAKMKPHLTGLASIADLAPTVNALLQAISNVGM